MFIKINTHINKNQTDINKNKYKYKYYILCMNVSSLADENYRYAYTQVHATGTRCPTTCKVWSQARANEGR